MGDLPVAIHVVEGEENCITELLALDIDRNIELREIGATAWTRTEGWLIGSVRKYCSIRTIRPGSLPCELRFAEIMDGEIVIGGGIIPILEIGEVVVYDIQ